jgi:hypothetical protein
MESYSKNWAEQQSSNGRPPTVHRVASGAIIFIDLDGYLKLVAGLSPAQEWEFAAPIYGVVEIAADKFGLLLIRTFGDGFLLCLEGEINRSLLKTCALFLAAVRDQLSAMKGMSFKASVVGGTFVVAERLHTKGLREVMLSGAAANLAGKQLSRLGAASAFFSWPVNEQTLTPLSFLEISKDSCQRRTSVHKLTDIQEVPRVLLDRDCLVQECILSPLTESTDILKFINDAKTMIIESIKLADDKAKAVFGIAAAFLVYLFNGGGWPKFASLPAADDFAQIMRLASLVLAMFMLFISSVFSLLVVKPRMKTAHRGIVFFRSIAEWSSASEYSNVVLQSDISKLRRESAMHNYELAGVAVKKFRALNRCLIWMAVGVVFALAYIGLSWSFTRDDTKVHTSAGVGTGAPSSPR